MSDVFIFRLALIKTVQTNRLFRLHPANPIDTLDNFCDSNFHTLEQVSQTHRIFKLSVNHETKINE